MNKTIINIVSTITALSIASLPLYAGRNKGSKPTTNSASWRVVTHGSSKYSYVNAQADAGDLVTVNSAGAPPYVVFFIKSCTNLTGKTLSAGLMAEGILSYWGEGTSANPCYGTPASFRLIFWSSAQFSLADNVQNQYWYSNPINSPITNIVETIIESIDSLNWSDGLGRHASDPAYTASFLRAAENAKICGVCAYGGCFFDRGIYGRPAAIIRLKTFDIH